MPVFRRTKVPGEQDSNQNHLSGANLAKVLGARSELMPQRIASDEQRRNFAKFARPKGS